ncbi:AMP-binding protein [Streptacidiphilus sp. ASG 303]|uniref:AMP-binding protein n=1 Tax=Streptacidiphilus sp. ASG 303 TaxID=2896847 RepID=UPI001E519DA2|nr:AMP-binding protein [Streptacidiphilus sp. ASG 303]MCD0483780.1 AMP-binding protein [Streptacidiphilus sp. ASG 303]
MVYRSEYPDVPVLDVPIHDAVLGGAAGRGDLPALVDGVTGQTLTYAQLDAATRRAAAGLAEAGVAPGDVVALHSPNTVAYPVAFYAATRAGATVTTVSSLATPGEMAAQLRDSGARWIVTVSPFLPTAREAAAALAGTGTPVREIFSCDPAEGHRNLFDLVASTAPEPSPAIDPAADVAVLPYSSGTTGTAKGVMLTHRNIATNLAQLDAAHRPGVGQRIVAVLPFFHIYGLTALMNHPLRCGSTVVVLPRFDLEQFLQTLQDQRIQGVYAAPPMVLALARHPAVDRYDLSSLEYVLSAAAPLDADLADACARRLGIDTVRQAYGMTELSPGTHLVPLTDTSPPPGAVGRLLASTEMRVVAVEGGASAEDLPHGEPGELLIRGPQVMKGYFGRPTETDAVVDGEGWLHTGDVGYVDDRGYLHVVDRVKELIKYKGYQVAPAELEAVLLAHPEVADAAVIGVAGPDGGEVPKAFVVRGPGSTLTDQQVIDHVAGQVAPYKKVRAVEFVDAVPKSAAGKILRRRLRERERGAAGAQAPAQVPVPGAPAAPATETPTYAGNGAGPEEGPAR